ncbi:MAG TPA: GNAT family N-acetyltransferase [Haliangiales bacterium]|nr:GNAT family N-acetyltransferase [Haliangiales bacterium]
MPITIVPARPSASPLLTDEQRRQLDTLDDILVKGEGALRVAVEAGARVGHLLVFLRMSPAVTAFVDGWNPDRPGTPARLERERAAYVTDVLVVESARRRGVATLLLEDAAKLARAAGLARLVLHVAPDNHAALALYAKLGFARGEETGGTVELALDL